MTQEHTPDNDGNNVTLFRRDDSVIGTGVSIRKITEKHHANLRKAGRSSADR